LPAYTSVVAMRRILLRLVIPQTYDMGKPDKASKTECP